MNQKRYLVHDSKQYYEGLGKEELSPNPLYFKLTQNDYSELIETVNKLDSADLKGNKDKSFIDGTWFMFSIISRNKLISFENVNYLTKRQKRLLNQIIGYSIKNNRDSITNEYLRSLKRTSIFGQNKDLQ